MQVRKAATVYMALPLFCFLGGFLRWYYAIISCAVLGFLLWLVSQSRNREAGCNGQSTISIQTIAWVFVFSMLWSYFGGMNGYFYQSTDWNCRNAIYFDLIHYRWPVVYDLSGQALVYYIGHWLPPAALAKAVQHLSGSVEWGRSAGRMLLWLWSSLGLTIIILMVFSLVGACTRKKRIAATLILAFFSGLDVVGAILLRRIQFLLSPEIIHLEWWCSGYQFSSITTCLFWVFNQTIIPWMITICFLSERDPRNYIFYCVVCLLCGTLPCIGLVVLMVFKAADYCLQEIRTKNARGIPRIVFSVQNLLAFFVVFPLVASFILTSNIVGLPGVAAKSSTEQTAAPPTDLRAFSARDTTLQHLSVESFAEAAEEENDEDTAAVLSLSAKLHIPENLRPRLHALKRLALFLTFEVGLYLLCIFPDHYKNLMYYVLCLSFLLIPDIHVGYSTDFCMRASVPGVFILMLYVNRFLLAHFPTGKAERHGVPAGEGGRRAAAVVLAICFMLGTATPIVEFSRGIYHVAKSGTLFLEDRSLMTFNREEGTGDNFACSHPEDYFFFKYLAG